MLDKPYRRVRQPLKTEIFMLVWMSTESIHNDRLSSVGSSALGREPFPILLWSKVSKGVCGTLFVEESNIFGDLPRDIVCRCDVQICKQLGLYPSVDGFHGGIVRWSAGSGHGSNDVIHGQCTEHYKQCLIHTPSVSGFRLPLHRKASAFRRWLVTAPYRASKPPV